LALILIETDAAAIEITAIYNKVAEIKKMQVAAIQKEVKQNSKNIFKK
jgi:Tat protein secretion system quality control protein TatD with DNase activity